MKSERLIATGVIAATIYYINTTSEELVDKWERQFESTLFNCSELEYYAIHNPDGPYVKLAKTSIEDFIKKYKDRIS